MPLPADIALLGAALLVASVVHGALGFGSAPVLAPIAVAVLAAAVGVGVVLLVGTLLSVLVVAVAQRRHRPALDELGPLWLGIVPGAVAGALALDAISATELQVVIAVVLALGAVAALAGADRVGLPPGALRNASAPAVGATLGFSGALTGVIGPLAALAFVRAIPAARHREASSATVAVAGVCGLAAHVVVVGPGPVAAAGLVALAGLPVVLAGLLAGRALAARLDDRGRRIGALTGVLGGAVLALVAVPLA